uniref:Uncharacterized protein n=1 Tax=Anguilla anguilla TaxID=7936 RepID=A0A0E9V763_ANGAN
MKGLGRGRPREHFPALLTCRICREWPCKKRHQRMSRWFEFCIVCRNVKTGYGQYKL